MSLPCGVGASAANTLAAVKASTAAAMAKEAVEVVFMKFSLKVELG